MAALATQSIRRSGVNPAYVAATGGGDTCTPGMRTFLHIKNGGASPITVTLDAVAIPETDMLVADLAVVVTNAQERMIGPIDPPTFARASDGQCAITYSSATSVTVGIFDLGM